MKRSHIHCSFRIATVFLFILGATSLIGQQTGSVPCPAGIHRDDLKQRLDREAFKALEAVKKSKPENLMLLLSANGVGLGVDGPLLKLPEIRKQMSHKTGIYCVIYDSSCLIKEVNDSRRRAGAIPLEEKDSLSFRDQLLKTDSVVKIYLLDDQSSCGGITSNGSPSFELEWGWTAEGWKIVAIPYL
jgi:hypothetical protein